MVRTTAMLLLAGAMLAPTTFATFSGSSASTAAEGTPITDAATAEVSFPGAAGSATLPYWPRSVAPGRRLQDDVPVPTAVPLPAPTAEFCGLGNPKGNVCCGGYEECHGSCGGAGCDSWDGGAALCCARTIRKAGVECEDHADVGCLIPWSSQPSTSPAPTRIPDEPSARPSPAPTPRPTDGGDWSDAAWRSAGEWAGSFETGQSHVVRPVNETRCCCCSLAFYRPAESSIRPRSDDAPLWVGRWCHPPATSERCAVVGRRGRYAPRVTAERELELLFTPSAAGVSGGGGGVPSDADDVRVTAWARGARRLGTLAARPPSALRAALEQALTYDHLSPYSDAAWSATLPWDWVVENATLRVGWRRAAAADGGGGDGGLVSATLELRDLAHWSLFTVSRTKVAIFGGVSDVAALDGTITLVTTMLKTLTVRCLPT